MYLTDQKWQYIYNFTTDFYIKPVEFVTLRIYNGTKPVSLAGGIFYSKTLTWFSFSVCYQTVQFLLVYVWSMDQVILVHLVH